MIDLHRIHEAAAAAVPNPPEKSIVEWARKNVRLIGSARSESFDPQITPWIKEPLERINDGVTRKITFVKPVQSGGSAAGEIAICYWISNAANGDCHYNWEDNEKAADRWDKRFERILKASSPVAARWPVDRSKSKKCLVNFAHMNLTMQGVFTEENLDSDSVRFEVNEEIHNWEPGRLEKAYNRTTAYWNSVVFNISNAGTKGDQLDQAFRSGSMQYWEVKCPKCGSWHAMRTEAKKDERGGLRYDAEGCRNEDGTYNYPKLIPTVRYEFPCCDHDMRDVTADRRALSLGGRYSEPANLNAPVSDRSYTFEAVAVDYIPWWHLIKQKHDALRALRRGDPEPFRRYKQERECKVWDPEDRPLSGKVVLVSGARKDRDGLTDRVLRPMTVDKQAGSAARGEVPHYWVVIRDYRADGSSMLVYEGRVGLDADLEVLREKYEVEPRFVLVDSGFAATSVYQLCARYGYNALKGEDRDHYLHEDEAGDEKVRRIYSPIQMIDAFEGDAKGRAGQNFIPLILYSKQGIRDRLEWLRGAGEIPWEVPEDVSQDYKEHMESEELRDFVDRDGATRQRWSQVRKRNDLFVCECYQVLCAEMAGLIGVGL